MALDIENLFRGETFGAAGVYISYAGLEGSTRLRGINQGNFSISGGNEFNTPLLSGAQDKASEVANIFKGLAQRGLEFAGRQELANKLRQIGQIQLKNINQTTNFWTGSQRPKFTLSLFFIALRLGDDVRDMVKPLYRTVYPSVRNNILRAPLDYSPETRGGLITIQLGNGNGGQGWFRGNNFVMNEVNFEFSKEQTPLDAATASGASPLPRYAPLYAKGTISFEPYRDVTYDDFIDYFPGIDS